MKKLLIIIIALAVVGGGAFYGGMKYEESKRVRGFQDFSQEQKGQMRQRFDVGRDLGTSLVTGEIIAKDEKSITIKLHDGGSKIIFFSESTDITKSGSGSIDDLKIAGQIFISGEENPDGSYTAKTIQIRP